MSRFIDADALKKENERLLHCDFPYLSETTLEELIDEAPTIDAVPEEIIRLLLSVAREEQSKAQANKKVNDLLIWTASAATLEAMLTADYTIDSYAEPVRHGKWIESDEYDEFSGRLYRCSNCNTFVIGDMDNYCPFCGARMDKE